MNNQSIHHSIHPSFSENKGIIKGRDSEWERGAKRAAQVAYLLIISAAALDLQLGLMDEWMDGMNGMNGMGWDEMR